MVTATSILPVFVYFGAHDMTETASSAVTATIASDPEKCLRKIGFLMFATLPIDYGKLIIVPCVY